MKTERRHELQTNVLADWLGHYGEQLRPYGKPLLLTVAAIAVIAAGWTFVMSDQSSRAAAGWSDFFAAADDNDAERLGAVARDHAGTVAGLWALLNQADLELANGLAALYKDRDSAKASLERARASYEDVESQAADHPELLHAARFGLAQYHEASGDLDEARKYYRLVAEQSRNSAVVEEARERQELLADPDLRRFYNWFANQKPVPPPSVGSFPGGPPDLPGNLNLLADQPDFPAPSAPPASQPDLKVREFPLTEEKTPADGQAPGSESGSGEGESGEAATPSEGESEPEQDGPQEDGPQEE